jgi:nitroreductase
LLSLHAEGIGTKWATGAVVKTPAFRSLFHFEKTDRVVGLIMVGGAAAASKNKVSAKRHHKRREDLVQDV